MKNIIVPIFLLHAWMIYGQNGSDPARSMKSVASKDTLLIFFSRDSLINDAYCRVAQAVFNKEYGKAVLKVSSEKEMSSKINSGGPYMYFKIDSTRLEITTITQEGISRKSRTDILINYSLCLMYKKYKKWEVPIFLEKGMMRKEKKNCLLHGFSPQISPVHIGSLLLGTIYSLKEDYYKDLEKIKNDTLYFPTIAYKTYRPMAYGRAKRKKHYNRTKPYKFDKLNVKDNMELTEIFIRRLKDDKPMYMYECVRVNSEMYYMIIDIIHSELLYSDYDNFSYNQRRRFFRWMNERIGKE